MRVWRNSEFVKQSMLFKDTISKEQQHQWYTSINNNANYYFIIEIDREAAGVAYIKNIDRQKGIGEPGIFFNDIKYSDGIFPMNIGIMLIEAAFLLLALRILDSKVAKSNTPAFKFNENLGFLLMDDAGKNDFFSFKLQPLQFAKQQKIIRNALAILHGSISEQKIKLTLSQQELYSVADFIDYNYFDTTIV